jgi:hypothetical protein
MRHWLAHPHVHVTYKLVRGVIEGIAIAANFVGLLRIFGIL